MSFRNHLNETEVMTDAVVSSIATKYGMGGGLAASVFGWLTSNGAAIFIGIVVTIGGFVVNFWFQRRKEKRDIEALAFNQAIVLAEEKRKEELHQLQLAKLREE